MTMYYFLEPLDVLYLRGNRLFDGAGVHGEALMPPWPSLVAGAIRSRMLADADADFEAFALGTRLADPQLHAALGTPAEPGEFRIASFTLGRRLATESEHPAPVEPYLPLPADVVVTDEEQLGDATYLSPRELPVGSSALLRRTAVHRVAEPRKPVTGLWLNGAGWNAWLAREPITPSHLICSEALWRTDARLGVAVDGNSRTAATGMLYTAETIALCERVGFLVGIDGADALVPVSGLVRFGGDGRGAAIATAQVVPPVADLERIARDRRFRLTLSTPGVFPAGWQIPGTDDAGRWHGPGNVTARLVSAAVPRSGVVSGWDLAGWKPKTAHRVAAIGSVYWLDELEGDVALLRKLAADGLWVCMDEDKCERSRRAEGFNNVQIAAWPQD
ncbi:MAG: type III-B CRISPR module-associated protein Cmr3 [Gammaproteobacteria bacterium]|nr:type III-B CRISPR module-associated protein Cmr3 [Gammaproteobacteria bacterium]